ncbi:unnamed protein product [Gordionus sp. m RMFG-2023]|uniref:ESF1 homolog n=1 Tax=Gordionus sp. m RMFG-2023 TaxID=3053472 RepID=UPI0030E1D307
MDPKILKDDRFSHIYNNPKFKRMSVKANKIKIDKRFKGMFTDEKFKIKGTMDKRGRDVNLTSNEDMKRYYKIDTESETDDAIDSSVKYPKTDNKALKLIESPGSHSTHDSPSESESTQTDSDDSLSEDYIDHKWGELDADCPEIGETTNRLAVCNMTWELINAKDLFLLFDSIKPAGGIVKNVTIYRSEYGKRMKAEEDAKGPFAVMDQLFKPGNAANKPAKKTSSEDDESEAENFDIEKLRRYQINTMKYAYAIVECDTIDTAQHIYDECNGLEFEKTSNIIDLRYVPEETTFHTSADNPESDILSRFDWQMSIIPSIRTNESLPLVPNPCLSQTNFDLTWDNQDPTRQLILNKQLSSLYSTGKDEIRVGKSKNSGKQKRKEKALLLQNLLEFGPESASVPDTAVNESKGRMESCDKLKDLGMFLAPPSSNSSESGYDCEEDAMTKITEANDSKGDSSSAKDVSKREDKYAKYRRLLKGVLGGKEGEDLPDRSSRSSAKNGELSSNDEFDDDFFENRKKNGEEIMADATDKVMQITWEPELDDMAQDLVDNKLQQQNLGSMAPWEKYLAKDKAKKMAKKQKKLQKFRNASTEDREYSLSSDDDDNMRANHSKADLELLMMDDNLVANSANKRCPPKKRQNSTNESLSRLDPNQKHIAEPQKVSRKFDRKKKKRITDAEIQNDEGDDDEFECDQNDDRFLAIRSNPNYALDPSNPNFKSNIPKNSKHKSKRQRRRNKS